MRVDGTGALLLEGAAALLNSMTRAGFPYTTEQVRDAFVTAVVGGSDGAAAAQAAAFSKANEYEVCAQHHGSQEATTCRGRRP
jgi:hypothetical protein